MSPTDKVLKEEQSFRSSDKFHHVVFLKFFLRTTGFIVMVAQSLESITGQKVKYC